MTRGRSIRSGFEQRLLANLRSCSLADRPVTVGFSGGPDSLALAAGLRRIAPLTGLSPLLVHVDHGIRSTSSKDAARCQLLAAELDLPIEVVTLIPGIGERSGGHGLEEQARRERYTALAKVAMARGSTAIFTGHQANDQAESMLLHLFRGTGLQGLGGMRMQERRTIPWWTTAGEPSKALDLVRPMLTETRQTIEDYLADRGLEPVDDESNRSMDFDRNWIRLAVLPVVQERWPAIIETLGRSASATAIDLDFLDDLARDVESTSGLLDRTLCTDTLCRLPVAIAYRLLQRWLKTIGVEDVDFDVVARVYALAAGANEQSILEAGSGRQIVLADGCLTELQDLLHRSAAEIPIRSAGLMGNWTIELDSGVSDHSIDIPKSEPVSVRTLHAGDRWYGTTRTVFEDLRAAGIHPLVRPHVLAVVADGGVLLIPAIYPTIRAEIDASDRVKAGVRWRKRR